MILFYLFSCDDYLAGDVRDVEQECVPFFQECDNGASCDVCCLVGEDICLTECSDGFVDFIPREPSPESWQNDICHCYPSHSLCR